MKTINLQRALRSALGAIDLAIDCLVETNTHPRVTCGGRFVHDASALGGRERACIQRLRRKRRRVVHALGSLS